MNTVEELTELWSKLFDKIYVISLFDNGRKDEVEKELQRVGLLQTNKVYFHISYNTPLKESFLEYLMPRFWMQNRPNVKYAFDCSYNHYNCWNISKTLNHKRILVLEDDIRFLKDLQKIKDILENMPEDGDIILFDKIQRDFCIYNDVDKTYVKYDERVRENWSAACYTLSDKAITFLCKKQEQCLQPADEIMVRYFSEINLNRYFVKNNLGVQGYSYNSFKWEAYYIPYYSLNRENYAE